MNPQKERMNPQKEDTWRRGRCKVHKDVRKRRWDSGVSRVRAYPMQIGVRILRHVIIEGNVHPLNVHASTKQVGSHKNSSLKIFELLISRKPL
jgi:hypothetical protein